MSRNWNEVVSKELLFDRPVKDVEHLAKVGLEEVKACLLPLIKEKKLSVQVID